MRLPHAILILFVLAIFAKCKAFYSPPLTYSVEDSSFKHEIVINPSMAYRQFPLITSPMSYTTFYNNEYYKTGCQEYAISIDGMIAEDLGIGITVNYQPFPFPNITIMQPYDYGMGSYPFSSAPYSFIPSPEYEISVDYFQTDNINTGLELNYLTMECNSANNQSFYPNNILFSCYTFGIHALYYFEGRNMSKFSFYAGGKVSMSLWTEKNHWTDTVNNTYQTVIYPYNAFQLNLTLLGGIRYFFTPVIGAQLEGAFGFGFPYYAQLGLLIRLNKSSHSY